MARLAAAASRYLSLAGKNQLDASVTNPRMFSPLRRRAREELLHAIGALSAAGPQNPGEKELQNQLSTFADETIAAVFARYQQPPMTPQCADRSAIAPKTALRDVFDRLHKKRRTLLQRPEWTRGHGAWVKRARLLLVVLSDVIDMVDQRHGKRRFFVATARAQHISEQALGDLPQPHIGKLASSLYALGRGALSDDDGDTQPQLHNIAQALSAITELLDEGEEGMFATLAHVANDRRLRDGKGSPTALLIDHAAAAYAAHHMDRGDILLMAAVAAGFASDQTPPPQADALAQQYHRAIRLPLMLYREKMGAEVDVDTLAKAMREAVQNSCSPPSPEAVIQLRRAHGLFVAGKRRQATAMLDKLLAHSVAHGLTVPRQTYRYFQTAAGKVVTIDQSLSFAGPLLKGSGTFHVGLGYRTGARRRDALKIAIAPTTTSDAQQEAARLYATSAIVASVYHRLLGEHRRAEATARQALETWANGVRLGDSRVVVENRSGQWAADATAIAAIAAVQAADHGAPFLAGDLWTMVLGAVGEDADDHAVAEALSALPYSLRGLDALKGPLQRAQKLLPTLAAKLTCTRNNGHPERFQRVSCAHYPTALALRVAGGLVALPRLKKARDCPAWRQVDRFLGALDEQRYEPTALLAALKQLIADQRYGAAATLVTRQRHPKHCSPALSKHVRTLAGRSDLGVHMRASLFSIMLNCGGDETRDEDIATLDMLTQQHALPNRSFELLVYAAKLALAHRYGPLRTITQRKGFVRRWQRLGPQLATTALLLQHAAAIGSDQPIDEAGTLPFYRLLCTTFPTRERSPTCDAIAMMRSGGAADTKRAAKKALETFVSQALAPR